MQTELTPFNFATQLPSLTEIIYGSVYVLGFLGIPFLYASEIAPVQVRAAVCSISTTVPWLFNFPVAEVTPVVIADIGYRYFIVYAVIKAVCVPVVFFFYLETFRKSLEGLVEAFASPKFIFDTVSVATRLPHHDLTYSLVGVFDASHFASDERRENAADERNGAKSEAKSDTK